MPQRFPRSSMRRASVLALAALAAGVLIGAAPLPPSQADLDRLAATIGYRFTILDNHEDHCPAGMAQCFASAITLRMPNTLPPALAAGPLTLTYNFVAPLGRADSDVFSDTYVNGDLHRLTLKPGARLEAGRSYTITLWGAGHFFSAYYPMPGAYLSTPGLAPRAVTAARDAVDPATGIEYLPFVTPMTDAARLANAGSDDDTQWFTPARAYDAYVARGAPDAALEFAILPKPIEEAHPGGALLDLSRGVSLSLSGVTHAQIAPALKGLIDAGIPRLNRGPALSITVAPGAIMPAEGYRLRTANGAIRIEAGGAAGAAYALRSLAQQAAYEHDRLQPLEVRDAPRFAFRGVHVDIARNFHSKAEILKLIDAMAQYKLNKLHLHLADDEGWRLQIPALPELTEIGSRRCADPDEATCIQPQLGAGPDGTGPSNGFLTTADYIQIVKAATARQIEVIPSIDMPGHSRAAIRSMEVRYKRLMAAGKPAAAAEYRLVEPGDATQYRSIQNYDDNTLNVCLPQTYHFLDTALDALSAMHRAAGAPLRKFHIGADETAGAWVKSPACQALMAQQGLTPDQLSGYFVQRVAAMLQHRGIAVAGWSDGLGKADPAKMPAHVQSDIWQGLFDGGVAEAHKQANQGWDVVLSMPNLGYFDMPYAPDPNERGYDWATRGVDTFQVFGFMPENLPANADFIKDIKAHPRTIEDPVPLRNGHAITGIQAQLWSETVRGDAAVDYMLFPRLLALAERAWHRPDWEPAYTPGAGYSYGDGKVKRAAVLAGWHDFATRVAAQWPWLDRAGIAYRLAPPGARIVNGTLEAVAEFPGLAIQYRAGGEAWGTYHGPVTVSGPVEVRSVAPDGRPGRAVPVD